MSPLELRTAPFCSSPQIVTVVTVSGAIGPATAPQLRSRLDAVPDRGTVVDLAGVTLLAAAGIAVLLDLHHRLDRVGAQLVLLGVPPLVRRALAAAGLDTALPMSPVVTEAVELATAPYSPENSTIPPRSRALPSRPPRHLRAMSELVDSHQIRTPGSPDSGDIA